MGFTGRTDYHSFGDLGAESKSAVSFFEVLKRYSFDFFRRFSVMRFIDIIKLRNFMVFALAITCVFFVGGCKESIMSSPEQVNAFNNAGPITPEVDIDKLLSSRKIDSIYRVVVGDVIEFQMPTVLTAVSPEVYKNQFSKVEAHLCRVDDSGYITLPIVGQMQVEGKTLAGIEAEVVNMYYPKYLVVRPSVVCTVKEHRTENVTIVGAVMQPGVYQMQSNEMSLVNLIMKAGGIIEEGASVITIKNPKRNYVGYVNKPATKAVSEIEYAAAPAEPTIYSDNNAEFVEILDPAPVQSVNNDFVEYLEVEPTPAQFEELEFDLVFRPSSGTEGSVVIEHNGQQMYSSFIDLSDSAQRKEYISGLEAVIGSAQANIIAQALEQLAMQLVSAVTSDVVATLSVEDDELFSAADDYESGNSYKGCAACDDNYIEYPTSGGVAYNTYEAPAIQHDEPATAYIEPVNTAKSSRVSIVEPIVLPVKGLNIPFADITLMEGDLVEVKRLNNEVFTVIGLAKTPGAFPYAPDIKYNLMQAIGFAGGVDLTSDPRFVSVYRQDRDGKIVSATFRIDKEFASQSYAVQIKPGDVISIDNTARTKMNTLIHQALRVNVGFYLKPGF